MNKAQMRKHWVTKQKRIPWQKNWLSIPKSSFLQRVSKDVDQAAGWVWMCHFVAFYHLAAKTHSNHIARKPIFEVSWPGIHLTRPWIGCLILLWYYWRSTAHFFCELKFFTKKTNQLGQQCDRSNNFGLCSKPRLIGLDIQQDLSVFSVCLIGS